MVRRFTLILLTILTLALSAKADREALTGFEFGDNSSGINFFDTTNCNTGTDCDIQPSATTATNGNPGNDFSIEFNSNTIEQSEYGEVDVTSGNEYSAHFWILFDTLPTVDRTVWQYRSSSSIRCFLQFESSDNRLYLYYEDDVDECSSSNPNFGTACATNSDCEEINSGEAECTSSHFAKSTALSVDTWYEIFVAQDSSQTNAGDVQCELWVDGLGRGSSIRPQGVCSGGTRNGDACSCTTGCNYDCPDGGSCGTTDVGPVTEVRMGMINSVSSEVGDVNFDELIVDNTRDINLVNNRVEDIHPDGEISFSGGTAVGCTAGSPGIHQCLDDLISGGNLDFTDYITDDGAAGVVSLEDITLAEGESIATDMSAGVFHSGGKLTSCGGGTSEITMSLKDGSSTSINAPTVTDYCSITGSGYHLNGSISTAPGGGSWDLTEVNALRLGFDLSDTGATSLRSQAGWVVVEITTPAPVVPNVLTDQNADGQITVCLHGDSRLSTTPTSDRLIEDLQQPDNILQCSQGGNNTQQFLTQWDAILNGGGSGAGACFALKGGSASCDYSVLDIGVNDFHTIPNFSRKGFCWDYLLDGNTPYGGSMTSATPSGTVLTDTTQSLTTNALVNEVIINLTDGSICTITSNTATTITCTAGLTGGFGSDNSWDQNDLWMIKGPDYGNECEARSPVFASTNRYEQYCRSNGDTANFKDVCTSTTDCDSHSIGSTSCTIGAESAGSQIQWCVLGDPTGADNCTNGLCSQRPKVSLVYMDRFKQLVDTAINRTGSEAVELILVKTTLTSEDNVFGCWSIVADDLAWSRNYVENLSTLHNLMTIDFDLEFRESCEFGDVDNCLFDPVHYSSVPFPNWTNVPTTVYGAELVVDLMTECLEGVAGPNVSCAKFVQYLEDNFDRANNNDLTASCTNQGPNGGDCKWDIKSESGSINVEINSNTLLCNSGGNFDEALVVWTENVGDLDQCMLFEYTTVLSGASSDPSVGGAFRYDENDPKHFQVVVDRNGLKLQQYTDDTTPGTSCDTAVVSPAFTNGDYVGICMQGAGTAMTVSVWDFGTTKPAIDVSTWGAADYTLNQSGSCSATEIDDEGSEVGMRCYTGSDANDDQAIDDITFGSKTAMD